MLTDTLSYFVDRYGRDAACEVSCEGSVSSLTRKAEKVDILERYVNRLSIGVQSFNDRLLRIVERTFTGAEAIELLQEVVPRFASVNIDLLYGLETQTERDWLDSIETAIDLRVPS